MGNPTPDRVRLYLGNFADIVDDVCFYRGLKVESVNHPKALYHLNTDNPFGGEPAGCAWVSYRFGTDTRTCHHLSFCRVWPILRAVRLTGRMASCRAQYQGRPLRPEGAHELKGAVVDPDLIDMRTGLLAAAFGIRIPQKACWPHYQHPWNGDYLAFSQDGGSTWPNVVRMTSGIPTTHYMALDQTPTDNDIYVTYDYGFWGQPKRYIYGRYVRVTAKKT
jgi:hypothetical protein